MKRIKFPTNQETLIVDRIIILAKNLDKANKKELKTLYKKWGDILKTRQKKRLKVLKTLKTINQRAKLR